MKKHGYFLTLLFLLSFFGCEKDKEKVNFTITFRALYDGQPLERYKTYPYGNRTINFSRFSTYLSNIEAVNSDGAEEVSEIEYVEFTNDTVKQSVIKRTFSAPAGDYSALRMGFGVAPGLNKKRPSDFDTKHPLYLENEYWIGWKSYIFTKIEGNYDANGDGTPETALTYHCGDDQVFFTADILSNFTVDANGNITVDFDLKKAFTFEGQLLDLEVTANRNTSHSASNLTLGKKMIQNLDEATSVSAK
jgi:hypothetical protein